MFPVAPGAGAAEQNVGLPKKVHCDARYQKDLKFW